MIEEMNRRAALRLGLLVAASVVTRPGLAPSAAECRKTEPDTQGPFYLPGAPTRIALAAPARRRASRAPGARARLMRRRRARRRTARRRPPSP